MSQNSNNKENSIEISAALFESNTRSKITIEKIHKPTNKNAQVDENNNSLSSSVDTKSEEYEHKMTTGFIEPNEIKIVAKRQALKSIQNMLNNQLEKSNETKNKEDDSLTLFLACTSDPIHDILLNNFRSSEIKIPPFQARMNLQCSSDDQNQVLSDNIDDLFTYKIIVEKENPVPVKTQESEGQLFDEEPATNSSFEITSLQDIANNPCETSPNKGVDHFLTNNENIQPKTSPSVSLSFKRKYEPIEENELLQSAQPLASSFKKIRTQMFDNNDFQIVMNLIKKIFTVEEIQKGIFPDKYNTNRSKCAVSFDQQKIELLKKEIAKYFNLNENEMNEVWYSIRPKLNVRVKCLRKTRAYSQLN